MKPIRFSVGAVFLGFQLVATLSWAQTGKYVTEFLQAVQANGIENTAANKEAFYRSYQGANQSMMKRTTAVFADEYKSLPPQTPLAKKSKENKDSKPQAKSTSKSEQPYFETATKSSRINRESNNTGMIPGSEAGAEVVTFGKPRK